MSLQALVLCSDEKILRVLRRVLSDLEVKVEHCTERDAAIRQLTRDRFEPVTFRFNDGASQQHATTIDLGEGGIAVKLPQRPRNSDSMSVHFLLPGTEHTIACIGQIAWENAGRQFGIRFVDLSPENRAQLK